MLKQAPLSQTWDTETLATFTKYGALYSLVKVTFHNPTKVRYEIVTDKGGYLMFSMYKSSAVRAFKREANR